MCRLPAEEVESEYQALSLLRGLVKFPEGDGRGIFTECLIWCAESSQDMPLSLIHKVALALQTNADPMQALGAELAALTEIGESVGDVQDSSNPNSAIESLRDLSVQASEHDVAEDDVEIDTGEVDANDKGANGNDEIKDEHNYLH